MQFDCELPEDAYAELSRPKRPVILGRPVYQPPERSGIFKWVGGFALCAIILAAVVGHYSEGSKTPAAFISSGTFLHRNGLGDRVRLHVARLQSIQWEDRRTAPQRPLDAGCADPAV